MKKLLAFLLSVLMVLAAAPLTAFAVDGPSEMYEMWDDQKHYFAYIYAYAPDSSGEYFNSYGEPSGKRYAIFAENTVNNTCPGVTYKRDVNELVIENQNQKLMLDVFMMGDDFALRIDGNASLAQITVGGGSYGGNLHIKGNGRLTVNKDKRFTTAITLHGYGVDSKVTVGADVYMDLYAGTGAADKVMETFRSGNTVAAQAYTFENAITVTVGKAQSTYEAPESINAIYLADPDEERWAGWLATRTAGDDGYYYVVNYETDSETEEELVTLGRYAYAAAFDAYVRDYDFGDRYTNGYEYVFTEDEWNSQTDYVVTEDMLEWTGTVVQGNKDIYEDTVGNRYIIDYDGNVYDYGTQGISIGDTFYVYAFRNDAVSADDLNMVFTTETEEGLYNYYIDAKELHYAGNGQEPPVVLTGWQNIGGKQYYYRNGKPVTYRQNIDGKWYYFNSAGVLQKGWIKGGSWLYADKNGVLLTGWQKLGGKWYLFNSSCAMLTGWQKSGGKWYYFNSSGAMLTGWQKISGKWYLFNSSGAMLTGWQKNGGKWYYFNSSGAMLAGWQKIGGKWYYFNSGGDMVTGWKKIGSSWYYFESSGTMRTASLKQGGKTYYFNASGACTNP